MLRAFCRREIREVWLLLASCQYVLDVRQSQCFYGVSTVFLGVFFGLVGEVQQAARWGDGVGLAGDPEQVGEIAGQPRQRSSRPLPSPNPAATFPNGKPGRGRGSTPAGIGGHQQARKSG